MRGRTGRALPIAVILRRPRITKHKVAVDRCMRGPSKDAAAKFFGYSNPFRCKRADFAFEREDGTAWRHAVSSASLSSATLILASVTVVQPCLPHAFGTGENASGASMHLNSCSSGESFKLAVRRSEASVA